VGKRQVLILKIVDLTLLISFKLLPIYILFTVQKVETGADSERYGMYFSIHERGKYNNWRISYLRSLELKKLFRKYRSGPAPLLAFYYSAQLFKK
jgi:hypothetical protein